MLGDSLGNEESTGVILGIGSGVLKLRYGSCLKGIKGIFMGKRVYIIGNERLGTQMGGFRLS